MALEAVEDRLPAGALEVLGIGRLGIEADADADALGPLPEQHLGRAVAERVLDALLGHDDHAHLRGIGGGRRVLEYDVDVVHESE